MKQLGISIPDFVIKYREWGDLTQSDLARQLRVTPQYIHAVEKGTRKAMASFCARLMPFLDTVRANYLMDLLVETENQKNQERIYGKKKKRR